MRDNPGGELNPAVQFSALGRPWSDSLTESNQKTLKVGIHIHSFLA